MFVSKQLERMNIAIVFRQDVFLAPDNGVFSSLYSGPNARGMRFVEDPLTRTAVLSVPPLNLVCALEGNRFRIDDDSRVEPAASSLASHFHESVATLFPNIAPEGYGFNFDVYFRFGAAIPSDLLFGTFMGSDIFKERDLRDLGIQFSMERNGGAQTETYFMKIVDPLEIAVHANMHVPSNQLPDAEQLKIRLVQAYADIDSVVNNLKFQV
jgi:hypothetical protein